MSEKPALYVLSVKLNKRKDIGADIFMYFTFTNHTLLKVLISIILLITFILLEKKY